MRWRSFAGALPVRWTWRVSMRASWMRLLNGDGDFHTHVHLVPRSRGTERGSSARRRVGQPERSNRSARRSHRIVRMPREPLLEVCDLANPAAVRAANLLRGVSFDIPTATIAGLSGDSGCGKTTLALALLKLLPPAPIRVERTGAAARARSAGARRAGDWKPSAARRSR